MKKLSKTLAIVAIASASVLPLHSAQAWSGPWGMNLFGMDFGQSTGYTNSYGYPGYASNPWGMNLFGMDFGQSTGYASYYGYPYPPAVAAVPVASVTTETK